MADTKPIKISYKVNDLLIYFGEVFKITHIDSKAKDREQTIYFSSFFTSNKKLACSIPLSKLETTGKRRPISLQEAKELLNSLEEVAQPADEMRDMDDTLKQNNIFETSKVVKQYWLEQTDSDAPISYNKRESLKKGLKQMIEEIAVVLHISLDQARKLIFTALAKQSDQASSKSYKRKHMDHFNM